MKDIVVVALLLLAFALLAVTHVSIVWGLTKLRPRWRAVAAFALPPLAPYWAWREDMRRRSKLWLGALAVYAVALVLAYT